MQPTVGLGVNNLPRDHLLPPGAEPSTATTMSPEQDCIPSPGLDRTPSTIRSFHDTAACISTRRLERNKEVGTAHSSKFRGSDTQAENVQYFASGRPKSTTRASAFSSSTTFSRHDSLFSFGASSTRNAAELKSFLGNTSSRLKPGATVLPLMAGASVGRRSSREQVVSLEQAKPRARVEVDIVLESDCCVEGGYLRGSIKLRVRKRQKNEAPILLADGKVRVIGFESIPGETHRHAFYQRAGSLNAVTDAYTRVCDSSPDAEGFSRAVEGVHVLPFAMHLPVDTELGSPRGSPCLPGGTSIRYIAMISVKVKHSKSGKRSIAHFYRDCQVWPRFDPAVVFSSAPRPIYGTASGALSVIGGGKKLKLTAMLPRLTWVAGQRCYVHLSVTNETRKTVKILTLTLVRTITLFKPKPALDIGSRATAEDPDACQTTTAHKAVSSSVLERGQGAAKGHASAQGWWTGVAPGQEAQFSHSVLITPDALSIPRARLVEVEYSIQVSLSAGVLASDVQVTLPIRVVNFLSLDPFPTAPLLSSDGSYARLVPRESTNATDSRHMASGTTSMEGMQIVDSAPQSDGDHLVLSKDGITPFERPSVFPAHSPSTMDARALAMAPTTEVHSCPSATLHVANPDCMPSRPTGSESDGGSDSTSLPYLSEESTTSLYSIESYDCMAAASSSRCGTEDLASPDLGNLELSNDAGSSDEVDLVLQSAHRVPQPASPIHTNHAHHPPEAAGSPETGIILDSATLPSSSWLASSPPLGQDSLGGTRSRLPASRHPADHRRPGSCLTSGDGSFPHEDLAHRLAADATSSATCGFLTSRPARPTRSPLRGGAGPMERRTGVGGAGLTSFERRVQEKKLALLGRTQSGSPAGPPEAHLRAPSECGAAPVSVYKAHEGSGDEAGSGDGGDDVEATPRLGDRNVCVMGGTGGGGAALVPPVVSCELDAGMQARPSRELPLPPPRSSQLSVTSGSDGVLEICEIPPSISALDAMRASQLGRPSGRFGGQSSSIYHRAAQAPPPQLVPSISSSSASSGSASCEPSTVPSSMSGLGFHGRSTIGLRNTGSSDSSIVKGRIAAFEERLKSSQDNGAAYM